MGNQPRLQLAGAIAMIGTTKRGWSMRLDLVMILAAALLALGPRAEAQSFSPFSTFARLKAKELATLQGKLTWLAAQREMTPSVLFAATGTAPNPALFVPFRRPGVSYGNDAMPFQTFAATPTQLAAMLAAAGKIPAVAAGGVSASPRLSFALVQGGKGFEVILDNADANALIAALMQAFAANQDALRIIGDLGCATATLGASTATEVSAGLTVTPSGIRRDRASGRYVQTITVKNTSGGAIPGPVSVILAGLPGSVTVINKAGTTCNISPTGLPFVNAPSALPPGGQADIRAEFDNPDALAIAYTTRVFAGPGPR
jgi:hypothetical protein